MVNQSRIRNAIVGFIIAVTIIVVFNKQLNDFADLIPEKEARLLIKASILSFFIVLGFLYPLGAGSSDMQAVED